MFECFVIFIFILSVFLLCVDIFGSSENYDGPPYI